MAQHDNTARDDDRSVVSTRTMEITVAAILLAFGATFLYSSYRLGFRWGSDGPQSGFFPFYVSLFICVASAATLLQAIFTKDAKGADSFVERGQLKQVLKVLIPAALYVLGIQLIGIYVASAIYIALFMNLLGGYPWKKSVPLAVAISVLFFFMFEVWFQVPLVKGYWNLTGWTGF
ncbi:MAG TPA: tripartite tricarboxylate transporter TctB family protein [Casimicrobiaceae bacterium]